MVEPDVAVELLIMDARLSPAPGAAGDVGLGFGLDRRGEPDIPKAEEGEGGGREVRLTIGGFDGDEGSPAPDALPGELNDGAMRSEGRIGIALDAEDEPRRPVKIGIGAPLLPASGEGGGAREEGEGEESLEGPEGGSTRLGVDALAAAVIEPAPAAPPLPLFFPAPARRACAWAAEPAQTCVVPVSNQGTLASLGAPLRPGVGNCCWVEREGEGEGEVV